MPDIATIKNTIRKRVPELVGIGAHLTGNEGMIVREFRDSLGIAVAVDVDGVVYPILFRLPRNPARDDVLNVVDAIRETMKRIRRAKPTVREYLTDRKTQVR